MAIVLLTSIKTTGKTGCMTDENCKPGKFCNPRRICVRRPGAAIKRQLGYMEDSDCDEESFCSELKICVIGKELREAPPYKHFELQFE